MSRLKALSRVSTSTTVLYGSVERVVADATGHPPFVMSCSSTKPKELDDKVAKLHLPAFEMSCSFTVKVQAQLDLLWILTKTKAYKNDFQLLPKEIDSKVAKIALSSSQCELSAICGTCRIWSSTANSSSPSRAPAGVVPHWSSMANSSSPSRAPAAVRSRSGSREPKL